MSEVTLNLQGYKASGVYFEEIDNSISVGTTTPALRVAIGYNERGPFNRLIYLSSTADCDDILGGIDRKLERKGCYTNRNIRTMVKTAPLYALNLISIDTDDSESNKDTAGYCALSFDSSFVNIEGKIPFANMFDRSKFWVADASAMMNAIESKVIVKHSKNIKDNIHSALYGVGNCGTRDISIIVRKAEGLIGYNVTFLDWYGSKDAIPYKWIDPYAHVADYFIQVIAVVGDFSGSSIFSADPVWCEYFDAKGLKKEKLNKFLRLDAVTVLGNWTGCIIPDFYDKQGKCRSIDYLINRTCNKTGLLFGFNAAALDFLTLYADSSTGEANYYLDLDGDFIDDNNVETTIYGIDMTTMNIKKNSKDITLPNTISFLSYNIETGENDEKGEDTEKFIYLHDVEYDSSGDTNIFTCVSSGSGDYKIPSVGDYVRAKNGLLTKIVKKRSMLIDSSKDSSNDSSNDSSKGTSKKVKYEFTTISPVKFGPDKNVPASYAVIDDMNIENDGETIPENEGYQDYMVYGINPTESSSSDIKSGSVEVHKNISDFYKTLSLIHLPGLKLSNRHRPGFDTSGNVNIEAGVEKIYKMLEDPGIRKGLLNDEMIDFRYIVDTLGGGLGNECRGKKYLSKLAMDKGHCTALINMPSMSDFANSNAPIFCDDYSEDANGKPAFDVKYIPMGGNQDHGYKVADYQDFTLPTEENGAKHAAVFAPYLKYTEGTKTVLIPPAADVCNTFMQKFLGGDPYKTVANLNGMIINNKIAGLEYDLDKTDRGYLEPFGVNSIILNGGAVTIFGDRTCYQTINSDYNFLHVRELLNTIELRCKAILKDYVYTYNNAVTRAEIYNRIEPILKAMKDSGALAKYTIQVDDLNNTKEIIDEKFCIVDIGIWVTPNMEKLVTRITVNRGSEA